MRAFTGNQVAIASAVAAVVMLTGCSAAPNGPGDDVRVDSWDAIVASAEEEGSVTIYSAQTEGIVNDSAAAFQEEYPMIQVNVVREGAASIVARVGEELTAGAPTADIVEVSLNMAEANNPDWFAELDPLMPNLDLYPDGICQGE